MNEEWSQELFQQGNGNQHLTWRSCEQSFGGAICWKLKSLDWMRKLWKLLNIEVMMEVRSYYSKWCSLTLQIGGARTMFERNGQFCIGKVVVVNEGLLWLLLPLQSGLYFLKISIKNVYLPLLQCQSGVVWCGSTCWPFDELISTWCISKWPTLHMGSITVKRLSLLCEIANGYLTS
jgi:hypothetical protein